MTIKQYEIVMDGIREILNSFDPDTEIYQQALRLKDALIESQVPF